MDVLLDRKGRLARVIGFLADILAKYEANFFGNEVNLGGSKNFTLVNLDLSHVFASVNLDPIILETR